LRLLAGPDLAVCARVLVRRTVFFFAMVSKLSLMDGMALVDGAAPLCSRALPTAKGRCGHFLAPWPGTLSGPYRMKGPGTPRNVEEP
jgi:hypothetical protein